MDIDRMDSKLDAVTKNNIKIMSNIYKLSSSGLPLVLEIVCMLCQHPKQFEHQTTKSKFLLFWELVKTDKHLHQPWYKVQIN